MTSEKARLVSNYLRLLLTFIIGVIIVRLLAGIGPSALSIYLLVAAGNGFAMIMKTTLRESVIPVMGQTYDGNHQADFTQSFSLISRLSLIAAVFAFGIFFVFWLMSDVFQTGSLAALTVFVAFIASGCKTALSAFATPYVNTVLVSGRIVGFNAYSVVERGTELLALIGITIFIPAASEDTQTLVFFVGSLGLVSLVQLFIVFYARKIDPRITKGASSTAPQTRDWIFKLVGWNLLVVAAFLLYFRFTILFLNIKFGEAATILMGLVFLLIGYQRQIAVGLVIGMDAIISRQIGKDDKGISKETRSFVLRTSYIQAVVSCFSVTFLCIFVRPIFELWLGNSLDADAWDIDQAVYLFRIIAIGFFARSVSENWMKFLNGKGAVKLYAIPLIIFAIMYASLIIIGSSSLELKDLLIYLAVIFSVLHVIVHLGLIPFFTARELQISIFALMRSILLPFLLCLMVIGFAIMLKIDESLSFTKAVMLIVSMGLFGLVTIFIRPNSFTSQI